jgi:hypothetical protein
MKFKFVTIDKLHTTTPREKRWLRQGINALRYLRAVVRENIPTASDTTVILRMPVGAEQRQRR